MTSDNTIFWTIIKPVIISLGIYPLLSLHIDIASSGGNNTVISYVIGILIGILVYLSIINGIRTIQEYQHTKIRITKTEKITQGCCLGIIIITGITLGILLTGDTAHTFSATSISGLGAFIGGLFLLITEGYADVIKIVRIKR